MALAPLSAFPILALTRRRPGTSAICFRYRLEQSERSPGRPLQHQPYASAGGDDFVALVDKPRCSNVTMPRGASTCSRAERPLWFPPDRIAGEHRLWEGELLRAEIIDPSFPRWRPARTGRRPCPSPCGEFRSDQLVRPQEIVGLDDLAQFVFRRTISAIGVGMVAFHQFLVFRFDGDFGGLAVEF